MLTMAAYMYLKNSHYSISECISNNCTMLKTVRIIFFRKFTKTAFI